MIQWCPLSHSLSPPHAASQVNLFLRVVRRREDGFHDLASLFHVIDLGDDMKFAKSSSETRVRHAHGDECYRIYWKETDVRLAGFSSLRHRPC